jgi:hypothetical protein
MIVQLLLLALIVALVIVGARKVLTSHRPAFGGMAKFPFIGLTAGARADRMVTNRLPSGSHHHRPSGSAPPCLETDTVPATSNGLQTRSR